MKQNKWAKRLALAALLASVLHPLSAQEEAASLSLTDCVQYALAHNNNLTQQQLQEENARVTLNSTRNSRLPDVTASLGQNWGFGRSTSRDGTTVDNNSSRTSLQVGAQMPLFTGFRIPNQIKADEYSLKSATETLEKAKRDVTIQVASYYLNALYYRGLVSVQRHQLELDKQALANAKALCEAGKKPESEVATAQAQVATTEHSLTEAIGNEVMARLELMQMLNMEGDVQQFQIQDIQGEGPDGAEADLLPEASLVFDHAVETHPAILSAKYDLESSRYQLKAARSGYMPQLNLSAGYGTGYYYTYGQENMKFSKQFDINGSEYIGLSLNVPLFDHFSTRNTLRKSRLQVASRTNQLADARLSLNKEIQQAYWNAVKARDNYRSAKAANASTSLAYQYESERYQAGKGTSYELQQARTRVEKSEHDELQARYEYIMRVKILEYYNGKDL